MSSTSPPPEAQRFGRSQTPESPRPVHIPEPANIPVLLNQMDPIFNDTATYNIPNNQTFSPFPDPASEQGAQNTGVDELDAVQNFFREAEHQAAAEPEPTVNNVQNALYVTPSLPAEADHSSSLPLSANSLGGLEKNTNTAAVTEPNVAETAAGVESETHSAARTTQDTSSTGAPSVQMIDTNQQNSVPSTAIEGGVDYQSLLETISRSASSAPAADPLSATTTAAPQTEGASRHLPPVPGLPPKPPPLANPVEFPSYSSYDNGSDPSKLRGGATNTASDNATQIATGGYQVGTADEVNAQNSTAQLYTSHPDYEVFNQISATKPDQFPLPQEQLAPGQDTGRGRDPHERPWSPKTQVLYDQFLEDERRYVTEGIWDKFPLGSRLFVGNLPSEKVTKRDLFHKFHKHGRLAQISIKQAYGFVQFLEAASCTRALNAEQGIEIRGRKVHLEVSKPQKNTKNAGGGGGNSNKGQQRRRSRSPDRGSRRDNRNHSDFRDERSRRSEDFRNRRSSSPRGYRQRDDYRPSDRDSRPRSPYYGNSFVPPPMPSLDDEENLQIPRRDPRNVPDVQLLVLETEVVQSFINWVEQGFRNKGLQASTIWLNNRLPLPSVIKRQIIEGVQAVVKLTRMAQNSSKIPLQVFDRSAGASNVNFSEYVDLDVSIAADVVIQARQRERAGHGVQDFRPQVFSPQTYQPQAPFNISPPNIPYPQPTPPQYSPQQGQPPQFPYVNPQQGAYRPPAQPPTPTNQAPNLQQLLANLRQPPAATAAQNLTAASQNSQAQHLAGFLGNTGATQQYGQAQPSLYGQYNAGSSQQGGQQPNVQNIMEQLARYQR